MAANILSGMVPLCLSVFLFFSVGSRADEAAVYDDLPSFMDIRIERLSGDARHLKGLLDPIFLMAPINVLSEVSTPVSMAFRHFGNILSGTVISTLLYWALASLSHVIFGWLPGFLSQLQLFQIGIPAFTGLYFDWFGGCIQAFIFCTLTTIFIKRAAGEE